MIVELRSGGQLVISQCVWAPGVFIGAGKPNGSNGVIVDPLELDIVIAALTGIRAAVAERQQPPPQEEKDAA